MLYCGDIFPNLAYLAENLVEVILEDIGHTDKLIGDIFDRFFIDQIAHLLSDLILHASNHSPNVFLIHALSTQESRLDVVQHL
jgi:hypothetical protein